MNFIARNLVSFVISHILNIKHSQRIYHTSKWQYIPWTICSSISVHLEHRRNADYTVLTHHHSVMSHCYRTVIITKNVVKKGRSLTLNLLAPATVDARINP